MTAWVSLFDSEICYWWISFVFLQEIKEKIMVEYIENITDKEREMAQSAIESLAEHASKLNGNDEGSIEIPMMHIPAKVYASLQSLLGNMAEGKAATFLPFNTEMSVKQVANILRFPIADVNSILDKNKIPYRIVSSERKMLLSDVLKYDKELREKQDRELDLLTEEAQKLNLGY